MVKLLSELLKRCGKRKTYTQINVFAWFWLCKDNQLYSINEYKKRGVERIELLPFFNYPDKFYLSKTSFIIISTFPLLYFPETASTVRLSALQLRSWMHIRLTPYKTDNNCSRCVLRKIPELLCICAISFLCSFLPYTSSFQLVPFWNKLIDRLQCDLRR